MAPSLALWAVPLALAHVLAAAFLCRTWLLADPTAARRLCAWWRPRCAGGQAPSRHDADARTAEAATGRDMTSTSALQRRPPVAVQWRNLSCVYKTPHGAKAVLSGVSGWAHPSQLHGIIGPSGAGKSTLLDMLAHRKQAGRVSGRVTLDGQPATRERMLRCSAYVPQEDNFMPVLTAVETLGFYARLVLPPSWPRRQRDARCADVLATLGLAQCGTTLVGGHLPGGLTLRGLSGGERKRLALAISLLGAPSVLYLDEPTTGLDSAAALSVMRHLLAMARTHGQAVLASVHQPGPGIWHTLDQVTVLSQGLLLYTGPRESMVDWFTERLPRALTPAAPSDTSSSTGDEWPALPAGEAQPSLRYVSDLHGTPSDWIIDVVTLTEHQREHGAQPGHLEAVVVLPGAAESGPHAPPSSPPSPSSPRLTSPPAGTKERVDDCSSAACGGSVGLGSSRALALAAAAFGRHLDGVDGQALGLQRASGASTGDTSAVSAPASPRAAVAADPSAGKPGAAATQLVHLTAASGASVASPTTTAASSSRPEAALAASESSAGHQVPEQRTLDAGAGSFPAQHGQGWRWRCARAGAHLQALLWRECTSITRNPADVAGRLLTFSYIAVFAGLVFWRLPATLEGLQLRLNVHFSNTSFFMLMPFISMSLYTADRRFYLSDAAGANLYGPLTYLVAKVVATTPFHLLTSLVFCLVVSGMAGMRRGLPLAHATCISTLLSLVSSQVLHAATAIAPNQDVAFMLAIAWTAVNLMLSGYFIRFDQFSLPWLAQLRWVSAQAYAFEGLAVAELQGTHLAAGDCAPLSRQLAAAAVPGGAGASGAAASDRAAAALMTAALSGGTGPPGGASGLTPSALLQCEDAPNALLQYLGHRRGFGATFGILLAYLAVMHAVTYVALRLCVRHEKR